MKPSNMSMNECIADMGERLVITRPLNFLSEIRIPNLPLFRHRLTSVHSLKQYFSLMTK